MAAAGIPEAVGPAAVAAVVAVMVTAVTAALELAAEAHRRAELAKAAEGAVDEVKGLELLELVAAAALVVAAAADLGAAEMARAPAVVGPWVGMTAACVISEQPRQPHSKAEVWASGDAQWPLLLLGHSHG